MIDAPVGTLLAPGAFRDDQIRWLPLASRRSFFADPFAVVRGGTLHVLCEEFDYRDSKGRICSFELATGRSPTSAAALVLPRPCVLPLPGRARGQDLLRAGDLDGQRDRPVPGRRVPAALVEGRGARSELPGRGSDCLPARGALVAPVHARRSARGRRALGLACIRLARSVDGARPEPSQDGRTRRSSGRPPVRPRGRALSTGAGLCAEVRVANRDAACHRAHSERLPRGAGQRSGGDAGQRVPTRASHADGFARRDLDRRSSRSLRVARIPSLSRDLGR